MHWVPQVPRGPGPGLSLPYPFRGYFHWPKFSRQVMTIARPSPIFRICHKPSGYWIAVNIFHFSLYFGPEYTLKS